MSKLRVLIVDDQELMRTGFRMIIDAQADMTVVGEAADGAAAVTLTDRVDADVVLMDVRMPRLDGVEATRQITNAHPHTPKVLILTTFDLDEYVFAGLGAGASGFLLKDVPANELLRAIRTVAAGDSVVGPTVTRRLIEHYLAHAPAGDPDQRRAVALAPLTQREQDVLLALAEGQSNAEIGEELYLSEATVKSHVGHILTKLGLRDRVQAVVYAYRHDIVQLDESPPPP